jgi:hypothetical protein
MVSAVSTVDDRAAKYTKRAYKRAVEARRLQNILMRPASRKYKDVIIDHLRDTKVTRADIDAAEDIFGPNLGSLKGKTPRRPTSHVASGVDSIPPNVLKLHRRVTITIDIMFVNNLPFFVTKSRGLHFTTVEFLKDRRVATINSLLQSVLDLYKSRGLVVDAIFGDYEFELLRPWHPHLNTTSADEHVPDIERHIRTIKESTRSTYRMLPFRRLPRIVLIHLVKNAVFWLNALPTNDGITRQYSPRYIMTGQHIYASKHATIPFGAYVQTHEAHDNDMEQRTMSCICLGPTGNKQGGHHFMSLTSGERVVRHRWTELPMPRDAITRINLIGRKQKMPSTITYSNRHGHELLDSLHDLPDDVSVASDSDDDTYSAGSTTDDSDDLSVDTDASESDSDSASTTSSISGTSADDPPDADAAAVAAAPPAPHANQGVGNPGVGFYDLPENEGENENE